MNNSGLGYVLACIFELVDILENDKPSSEYNFQITPCEKQIKLGILEVL
jgi:hypothetical protein